jgi:hypothetical protein
MLSIFGVSIAGFVFYVIKAPQKFTFCRKFESDYEYIWILYKHIEWQWISSCWALTTSSCKYT